MNLNNQQVCCYGNYHEVETYEVTYNFYSDVLSQGYQCDFLNSTNYMCQGKIEDEPDDFINYETNSGGGLVAFIIVFILIATSFVAFYFYRRNQKKK